MKNVFRFVAFMCAMRIGTSAFAQESALAPADACASVQYTKVEWHPAAWPSPEFIERTRINYIGQCDTLKADVAQGVVTAMLADAGTAEVVRCKYEVAGLAELRERSDYENIFLGVFRAVADNCEDVATAGNDKDLASTWQQMFKVLTAQKLVDR